MALPSEFLLHVLFLRIVPVPERRILGYILSLFSEFLGKPHPLTSLDEEAHLEILCIQFS